MRRLLSQVFDGKVEYFWDSYKHSLGIRYGGYVVMPVSKSNPSESLNMNLRNFLSVPKNPRLITAVYSDKNYIYDPNEGPEFQEF